MSDEIEVVVGRIGKPHGLRGEVTVEVRTDEPDRRFADGTRLRAEPPRGSASTLSAVTVARTRWHQGVLLATFEELPDRNAAEAARGIVLHVTIDPAESPDDPDEFYDHQLVGLAAYDLDGAHLGEVPRPRARRRPGPADGAHAGRPRRAGAVRQGAGARGRRGRRPRRHRRPAGAGRRRCPRTRPDRMRIDVVSIFPDYLAPLELSLRRQGPRPAGCSTCTSTTCAPGPTTGTAPSTTRRTAAAPAW